MIGPIDHEDLPGLRHAFLIRDPARVVASYAAKRDSRAAGSSGVQRQVEYFEREADRLGHAPPVIDSADILAIRVRCSRSSALALSIGWDPGMLSWEPGLRETDGIWASHWYDAVAESTGFGSPDDLPAGNHAELQRVADACRPYYERLAEFRIGA